MENNIQTLKKMNKKKMKMKMNNGKKNSMKMRNSRNSMKMRNSRNSMNSPVIMKKNNTVQKNHPMKRMYGNNLNRPFIAKENQIITNKKKSKYGNNLKHFMILNHALNLSPVLNPLLPSL